MINQRPNASRTVEMLVNVQIMRLEREQALDRQQRRPSQSQRTARPEQRRPSPGR